MSEKKGSSKLPTNEVALVPQIAALLAAGKASTAIAQELNLGFNTVKRIAGLDQTKAMVKEIGDAALAVAKAVIKKRVNDNVELACEVLTEALKKDRNLDAVKLVFKVAQVLNDEPQQQGQGQQSLTIVMPGASIDKPAIEVQNETNIDS